VSEEKLGREDLMDAIWNAILRLFGEYGASQVSLTPIEINTERNYAILRCSHRALEMVRAAIASITEINAKPSAVHVIGVSGTLKSLKKKFSSKTISCA
jgi:RNase P/RNase MRP subunit POP5